MLTWIKSAPPLLLLVASARADPNAAQAKIRRESSQSGDGVFKLRSQLRDSAGEECRRNPRLDERERKRARERSGGRHSWRERADKLRADDDERAALNLLGASTHA